MAILKYDQVTAPDFTGVSSILRGAATSLKDAGEAANNLFKDINTSRQDMAEYQLRSKLNQLSPEQYLEAGRNFLIDPNNKEYLDRLSLDSYNTLATDAKNARNTLLSKAASNIYNNLLIEARNRGATNIPQMFGNTFIRNKFEQLDPELQKELFKLDKNLINFKTHQDYHPETKDNSFNIPVPIEQITSNQNTPASTIINNNVSKTSETSIPLDLSKYPKDKVEFAKKYIKYFNLKSPDDLGNKALEYNKVEFTPYNFEDNLVKIDPETREITKKILEANVVNSNKTSINKDNTNKANTILANNNLKSKTSFDVISSSTKLAESGNKGISTVGYDRVGGNSYGDFQINSRMMPAFVNSIKSKDPELFGLLSSVGSWNNNGAKDFWKSITANPEVAQKLTQYQNDFIKEQYWDIPLNQLSDKEKDILNSDPGLQQYFFDTMIQHGAGKNGLSIFRNAIEGSTSTDSIIRKMAEDRRTRFGSSTSEVQQGVNNRLSNMASNALANSTKVSLDSLQEPKTTIQVSEQTKSGTPTQKNIEVSANTLLDNRSDASEWLNKAVRNSELKKKTYQRNFEQQFRSLGLNSKTLEEAYDPNTPTGAEAIEKSVSSIYNTLIPKESEKNDPENAEEVRINILKAITEGQELGIPPKLMEGLILSGSYETAWLRQFITGKTSDVNTNNLPEKIKNNLQPLINALDSYKSNLKILEDSTSSIKSLADSIKESRSKVIAAKQKGLTEVVESERRKLNNLLGTLGQTFEKPLSDIQAIN